MALAVLRTGIPPSEWKALTLRERRAVNEASHIVAEERQ